MKTYTNKTVFLLIAILFIFATKSFSQEPMQTLEMPWEFPIQSLAFSPDGEKMLVGSLKPVLWDLNTNQVLHIYDDSSFDIRTVAFSSDGKYIAAGADGFMVMVWETETNRRIAYFQTQTHIRPKVGIGPVHSVAFSPDNKYLFTSDWYGGFKKWDVESGDQLMAMGGRYLDIHFSSNLGKLICLSRGSAAIINPISLQIEYNFDVSLPIQLLKNERVLVYTEDYPHKNIIIFNLVDKRIEREFPFLSESILKMQITPDEKLIAVAGFATDYLVTSRRILNLSTEKELRQYNIKEDSPKGSPESTDDMIRFLPDGKHILTVNYHKMHIYDISDLTSFIKYSEKY